MSWGGGKRRLGVAPSTHVDVKTVGRAPHMISGQEGRLFLKYLLCSALRRETLCEASGLTLAFIGVSAGQAIDAGRSCARSGQLNQQVGA